jgi:4-oxalocrotonate tautomerase
MRSRGASPMRINEVAKLPKEAVWVVFEDVTSDDWYVG